VGRAELAQPVAAFGRRRRDRYRAGPAPCRELDRHDPDAAGRAAHQHRIARSKAGMGQAEVGHYSGAPERHRVDGDRLGGASWIA
jgi:hypothetical protein